MFSRRITRWVIVLLLLVALPVMTAALAQEQEPAKQLPVVTEMGESVLTISWQSSESEPNNTIATSDWECDISWTSPHFGCVEGGTIGSTGDADYWTVNIEPMCANSYPVLIDIEAQSIASPLDPVICLYDGNGLELACNDDASDTLDSLLYYNFEADKSYYIRVGDYWNRGGDNYKYELIISTPKMFSAAAKGLGTGYVDGIPFQSGDILALSEIVLVYGEDTYQEKWVMLFDLSDLNVTGNLTNLASGWRNSDYLLVGFAGTVQLPGISGKVKPWDVVVFDPTKIGSDTEGVFQRWWTGKSQGLTTKTEKVDAIDWPRWNGNTRLYVSTVGKAQVPDINGGTLVLQDENVGVWYARASGNFWSSYNDFLSEEDDWIVPGLASEDVIALDISEHALFGADHVWFTIAGSGVVGENNRTLTQKDVAGYEYNWVYPVWHGPDHGWNYNIDAIDFPDHSNNCWDDWP